jgi:uncharacterized radical SAM superfamily Fe-S cluster-containing enzyme
MDKYNYDVERVKRCCIPYAMPDGSLVPFCAFNIFPELYRDKVQKKFSTPLKEWKRKNGNEKKYIRTKEFIRKVEGSEAYKRAYRKERGYW